MATIPVFATYHFQGLEMVTETRNIMFNISLERMSSKELGAEVVTQVLEDYKSMIKTGAGPSMPELSENSRAGVIGEPSAFVRDQIRTSDQRKVEEREEQKLKMQQWCRDNDKGEYWDPADSSDALLMNCKITYRNHDDEAGVRHELEKAIESLRFNAFRRDVVSLTVEGSVIISPY